MDLSNYLHHENKSYYIYITVGINERTGFFYIGQHKCKKKGEFDSSYFGSGVVIGNIKKKYGVEYLKKNFVCKPLWWCDTKEEADEIERFLIYAYDFQEIGENKSEGGDYNWFSDHKYEGENNGNYGKHLSDEQKQILSKYASMRVGILNPFFGKKHSTETKRKMSKPHNLKDDYEPWNKGKRCENISRSLKGKIAGEKHPNHGKHLSAETRRKISEANSGRKPSEKTMAIWKEQRSHISEETREKHRINMLKRGWKGESHPSFGRRISDEHKAKISQANKNRKISEETRQKHKALRKGSIKAYKNGVLVKEFDSWDSIFEFLNNNANCVKGNINSVLNTQKVRYGYNWMR